MRQDVDVKPVRLDSSNRFQLPSLRDVGENPAEWARPGSSAWAMPLGLRIASRPRIPISSFSRPTIASSTFVKTPRFRNWRDLLDDRAAFDISRLRIPKSFRYRVGIEQAFRRCLSRRCALQNGLKPPDLGLVGLFHVLTFRNVSGYADDPGDPPLPVSVGGLVG